MQPFAQSTVSRIPPAQRAPSAIPPAASRCALLLLDTVPHIMRAFRAFVSQGNPPFMTVPQFRTLLFVEAHAGASLSDTAEFLGLALPSASKQIDQLVKRGLVVRRHDLGDRRRVMLRITADGNALLKGAQEIVRGQLAATLAAFDGAELSVLERALELLQTSFPPAHGDESRKHSTLPAPRELSRKAVEDSK
jgi:DNA-binding MarR family transcriptional regulator